MQRTKTNCLTGLATMTCALVLSLGTGCASTDVRHRAAPEFSGAQHHTFRILTPRLGESATMTADLAQTLERGLVSKGYAVAAEEPDFVVGWKLLVDSEVGQVGVDTKHAAPQFDHVGAGGGSVIRPEATGVGEKLLFVFIQDAASMDVLWVGWSQATVTHIDLEKKTSNGMSKIVEGIPARVRS